MLKTSWAGRALPAAAALALALGAAGCGNRDDHANTAANAANRAANAAGTAANTAANVASNTANSVSNATASTTDTALKNTVQANLTRYGVTGVTVDVSDGEVTLKGSIPRAKLQDAMKAA